MIKSIDDGTSLRLKRKLRLGAIDDAMRGNETESA
jgi:hypothetical protein